MRTANPMCRSQANKRYTARFLLCAYVLLPLSGRSAPLLSVNCGSVFALVGQEYDNNVVPRLKS